jgi:hypothetical protein
MRQHQRARDHVQEAPFNLVFLTTAILHMGVHTIQQSLQYIQRLSPSTQSFVNARMIAALGNSSSTNGSTIAVHVRGGKLDRKSYSYE